MACMALFAFCLKLAQIFAKNWADYLNNTARKCARRTAAGANQWEGGLPRIP
jgi:hypothetical protein